MQRGNAETNYCGNEPSAWFVGVCRLSCTVRGALFEVTQWPGQLNSGVELSLVESRFKLKRGHHVLIVLDDVQE